MDYSELKETNLINLKKFRPNQYCHRNFRNIHQSSHHPHLRLHRLLQAHMIIMEAMEATVTVMEVVLMVVAMQAVTEVVIVTLEMDSTILDIAAMVSTILDIVVDIGVDIIEAATTEEDTTEVVCISETT